MMKKLLSLLLAAVLTLSVVLPGAAAGQDREVYTYRNPLYETAGEDRADEEAEVWLAEPEDETETVLCGSIAEAGAVVRSAMRQRQTVVSVNIPAVGETNKADCASVWEAALLYTGNGEEGDYLRWMYQGYTANLTRKDERRTLTYTITYYTTAEQEAQVTGEVNRLVEEFRGESASDADLLQHIYSYICEHVTYDHEHSDDSSYKGMFTAYNALFEGTAVCQGYALLFYRMAIAAGFSCRIIPGYAGEKHAWNIVRVEGSWYNVDSTWGANGDAEKWFLKGSENFPSHTRSASYNNAAFNALYPTSAEDYVPSSEPAVTPVYTAADRYTDVSLTDWFLPYVQGVTDRGMMTGTGNGLFSPNLSTTRAQFVQILYAMNGHPDVAESHPFTDVASGSWYEKAVLWAYENNITGGTGDGQFSPEKPLTRQELAVFLYALAGRPEEETDLSGYADTADAADWADTALSWCVSNRIICGVLNGDNTVTLNPTGGATRAETATMMCGYCSLTE